MATKRKGQPVVTTPVARPLSLLQWYDRHRRRLPWRAASGEASEPYRVWLSEIMLQQTQVSTVVPYYLRFMERFGSASALADAPIDDVLHLWSGLGYYRRAHHLHDAARLIVDRHAGVFPKDAATLVTLPGIGRSTAAAIAAFSAGVRSPILDGNVKRVFARVFGIHGYPGERAIETRMWTLAGLALPPAGPRQADDMVAYTQGLMDLGATVCSRGKPACLADADACPLAPDCVARRDNLTATLPTPKPRAAIPERRTVMLIVRHGREVLVSLRPASGIWGGLWSLPELPVEALPFDAEAAEDAALEAARSFGQPTRAYLAGELTHVFTHFRLELVVYRALVPAATPCAGGETRLAGVIEKHLSRLPAPVRRLLEDQARSGLF